MGKKRHKVKIQGKEINLSNLEKVLYPESGIVKAEIIQYYLHVAPLMLQFAQNRLLSVIRYPDGINDIKFYAKNAPDWSPNWLNTRQYFDDDIDYILFDSTPVAIWLANLASLEMHAMNSVVEKNIFIDHIVLDFDPEDGFEFEALKDLIIHVGNFLREHGFHPYVKTSGSRGAHIYIPIHHMEDYNLFVEYVKLWAKAINKKFQDKTTLEFRKEKRKGKVLIDINRNFKAQTTILPFSTRAIENAPVSMPLSWESFSKTPSSAHYNIGNTMKYIEKNGNAWSDFQENATILLGPDPKPRTNTSTERKGEITIKSQKQAVVIPQWFEIPSQCHMLATIGHEVFESDDFIYENKWDGIRVFVYVWNGHTKIMSKTGRNISSKFPEIILESKNVSCVLDGELVVLDEKGRPDFGRIISRFHGKKQGDKQQRQHPVIFYAFDIVHCNSKSCKDKSWVERRRLLQEILVNFPIYRLSEAIEEGDLLYEAAKKMGLEGVMRKQKSSIYESGIRSEGWQKIKFRTYVDCIILGYTKGEGDRSEYFGSLHIGQLIEGKVVYRGRVGTGFDVALLKTLMNLFGSLPKGSKWIPEKTDENNNSIWFTDFFPYCEIEYASITQNNTFREPVFKKLKLNFHER